MQATKKMDDFFQSKTCIVVCGASRGLGECISLTFARKFPAGSALILLGRDVKALENVKSKISEECPHQMCVTQKFDQGSIQQENFDQLFEGIFQVHKISLSSFEQAVMVHSAATLGDITKYAKEMTDAETVKCNFDVNVTGAILLNSTFLKAFDDILKRVVINISSLAAIQPIKSLSLYCSGKSARDMFFRTLAVEEPSLRVLNYAPGPCDTDMHKDCREKSKAPDTKQMFIDAFNSGVILSCQTSIDKLCQILMTNFESGAHIDFYD
ncbi:sepiapterin reductase-like [Saccostrea echinata]|uniref:sepiapterin reductase-like n=1 Tax=Saccostrea echinata TaxID=191078 RepID=UPI002A813E19|nr:sepiapterin reductase-like [Saccostrea echinata]